MNRTFVLFHLEEAAEELRRTTRGLKEDPEYDSGEFFPAMQHLYHHVNSAWNGRDAQEAEVANVSDASWDELGGFPTDLPLPRLS